MKIPVKLFAIFCGVVFGVFFIVLPSVFGIVSTPETVEKRGFVTDALFSEMRGWVKAIKGLVVDLRIPLNLYDLKWEDSWETLEKKVGENGFTYSDNETPDGWVSYVGAFETKNTKMVIMPFFVMNELYWVIYNCPDDNSKALFNYFLEMVTEKYGDTETIRDRVYDYKIWYIKDGKQVILNSQDIPTM